MGKFKEFGFVGSVVAGVLSIVAMVYGLVYSPLDRDITKESECRASEDRAIIQKYDPLAQEIAVMATDIKYIKRAVEKL